MSSLGVASKKSTVLCKGSTSYSYLFQLHHTCRDISFLYFSKTNIQDIETDMRSQLFSPKPDSEEISKNVKSAILLAQFVFVLQNAV